jgi:hypothetical protein
MPQDFEPDHYGPAIAELLAPERLNELGPGRANEAMRGKLEALTAERMWPAGSVIDREMGAACRSGLWLLHDFLDESHRLSQEIETPTGSFWHGIMHRREGDFSNAKYWFRRVGSHAVFDALAESASRLVAESGTTDRAALQLAEQPTWNPMRFVDLCQGAVERRSENEQLCRRIQQQEWRLLFDHGYCAAQKAYARGN